VLLADLLDVEVLELNAEHGDHNDVPLVAFIREDTCIGCTLCIQACPVDAILGSAKHMHTIIIDECTGCELCLPPCPVDCIDLIPIKQTIEDWKWSLPGETLASLESSSEQEGAITYGH
jgi:electron transport complex protein RnfB